MRTLLSIDLSSTCTGYSLFDMDTKKLITYGHIKGKTFKDRSSIRATLKKVKHMANEVLTVVKNYNPTEIIIEEISGSKNRLGQKTLDIQHGALWEALEPYLDIIAYCDVTGANGWRTKLRLSLSDADKLANKEAKTLNKKLGRGTTKLPIIGPKHLAARYVNSKYGLNLDVEENTADNDMADSIALGSYWVNRY